MSRRSFKIKLNIKVKCILKLIVKRILGITIEVLALIPTCIRIEFINT